ncbi:MAG TPA: PqqD family peptide modification chaperone [Acidimicrobiales bacterium]|nr:PqqD family peptide modification chaperone [Acidimicrobiales bacterium]
MGCPGKRVDQLEPVEIGEITPSSLESTIGPNQAAQAAVVDDQLVVLDPSSGYRVLLNASAALVFTAFDTDRRLDDVVAQLVDETGMGADVITPDVVATVDRLLARGLLTRGDAVATPQGREPVPAGTMFDDNDDNDPTVGRTWSFDSGVRAAAGVPVVVRVEPAALAADIDEALGALSRADTTPSDGAVVRIEIIAGPSGTTGASGTTGTANSSASSGDDETAQIVVDGEVRSNNVPQTNAVAYLFDQLDTVLADDAPGLRFHAGAVERDGIVVVVLGQSGHGKSTLTAALVQAGWNYLTDELVAIDPTTRRVAPYARPLDLDVQSLDELGIEGPDRATRSRKNKVFPSRLGQVSTGGQVAAIVVLTGEPADDGRIVSELPTAEAVMALLALTFAATFDDPDALAHLARMCGAVPTVRLHRGPLADMIVATGGLVAAASVPASSASPGSARSTNSA